MVRLIPQQLRRRECAIAAALTVMLWIAALFLWTASDLASGSAFPWPYKLVLAGTFGLGLIFSAILAAVMAGVRKLPRIRAIMVAAATAFALALLHGWIDAHMLA
jgi:hypothetical protein